MAEAAFIEDANTLLGKISKKALDWSNIVRYGIPEGERQQMIALGGAPGFANPYTSGSKPELEYAERALSNFLGGKKWGAGAPTILNLSREALQGGGSVLGGGNFVAPPGSEDVAGWNPEMIGQGFLAAMSGQDQGDKVLQTLRNATPIIQMILAALRTK